MIDTVIVSQTLNLFIPLLPFTILPLCIFHIINTLRLSQAKCDILLAISGLITLTLAFGADNHVIYSHLLIATISYFILYLRGAHIILTLLLPIIGYNLVTWVAAGTAGNKLIPSNISQMTFLTLFMKIFSLSHELRTHKLSSLSRKLGIFPSKYLSSIFVTEAESKLLPSFSKYIGYLYSPANLLFGPFISLKEHQTITLLKKTNLQRILALTSSTLLLLIFSALGLGLEGIFYNFIPLQIPPKLIIFAKIRLLKYSLNSLQELTLVASGTQQISSLLLFNPNKINFSVSRPACIEFPRSLLGLIFNWNLPFYNFIRTYVYFPCHIFGRPIAAILAYILTGILVTIELKVALSIHNLEQEFIKALISVSIIIFIILALAIIENTFRDYLADKMEMCVKSRPCPNPCEHNKENYFVTISTNLTYSLVVLYIFNAIGVVFL